MLAEAIVVGGSGLAHGAFMIFLAILIGLILWGLGRYFFPRLGMPPKGMLVWDGLFILIACIVVINFLAGLMGHSFIAW
jgi:hypothetical protein